MYAGDAVRGGVQAAESDPGEVKGLRPLLELVRKSPNTGRGACSRVSSSVWARWAWGWSDAEREKEVKREREQEKGNLSGGHDLRLCVPRFQ